VRCGTRRGLVLSSTLLSQRSSPSSPEPPPLLNLLQLSTVRRRWFDVDGALLLLALPPRWRPGPDRDGGLTQALSAASLTAARTRPRRRFDLVLLLLPSSTVVCTKARRATPIYTAGLRRPDLHRSLPSWTPIGGGGQPQCR
jgi:hypothetical protein